MNLVDVASGGFFALRSPMSAMGHKRTFRKVQPMSALPLKADISPLTWNVRCVGWPYLKARYFDSLRLLRRTRVA
jgi:hypothetical protein